MIKRAADHAELVIAASIAECAIGQAVDGSAIRARGERTVLRIRPTGGALWRFDRVQAVNDDGTVVDVWVRVE